MCSPLGVLESVGTVQQEKAALEQELQDKTALLAGVKDKTKAYVEKLKAEEAAAVAALEEKASAVHSNCSCRALPSVCRPLSIAIVRFVFSGWPVAPWPSSIICLTLHVR